MTTLQPTDPPTTNLPPPTTKNIRPEINQDFNREDMLAATEVWKQLQKAAAESGLTPDECSLMVEVTRILRRTNTGPSQAKKRASPKKVDTKSLLYD
jgi:hypothetical protein